MKKFSGQRSIQNLLQEMFYNCIFDKLKMFVVSILKQIFIESKVDGMGESGRSNTVTIERILSTFARPSTFASQILPGEIGMNFKIEIQEGLKNKTFCLWERFFNLSKYNNKTLLEPSYVLYWHFLKVKNVTQKQNVLFLRPSSKIFFKSIFRFFSKFACDLFQRKKLFYF